MSKLSLIDQAWYKLEVSGMSHMIMGGAMIIDPADASEPLDADELALHLMARTEKIPLMRKKVVQDSLKVGHMRKLDDREFDVRNHVGRITLRKPGGYKELSECLGEISAQRLDLSRPLWSYIVIDGLAGGLIAVVMKIHHCLLDGYGAMQAVGSVWDVKPVPAERPTAGAWIAEDELSSLALLGGALKENAERIAMAPGFIINESPRLLRAAVSELAKSFKKSEKDIDTKDRVKLPKVRKTSINASSVSSKRLVSYLDFPLREIKALCRHLECTVNDLVLLISSYSLQHYFDRVGENIDFDLVAAMTVNIRSEGDSEDGNASSVARINLRNHTEDLEKRLRAIANDTTKIKNSLKSKGARKTETNQKSGFDSTKLVGLFSPIVLDTLFFGLVKLDLLQKTGFCAGNVVISNVPGSPVELYLATAKQISTVPMAPVIDTFGLTISVSSTHDILSLGFHGCEEAIKDKELFVEGARMCFEQLQEKARGETNAEFERKKTSRPAAGTTAPPQNKTRSVVAAAEGARSDNAAPTKTQSAKSRPKPARKNAAAVRATGAEAKIQKALH